MSFVWLWGEPCLPQDICWTRLHRSHPVHGGAGLSGQPGWPQSLLELQRDRPCLRAFVRTANVPPCLQQCPGGCPRAGRTSTDGKREAHVDGGADFHPDIPLFFPATSLPLCQWRWQLQTRHQGGRRQALAPAGSCAAVGCNKWPQCAGGDGTASWHRREHPGFKQLPQILCVSQALGYPGGASLGVGGPSCQASQWGLPSWGRIMLLLGS